LRLAAHIGLVVGVMGVCTLGWVGVSYMTGHVLAGWTSLVGTVLLLGSVQLMMLGVFGEYLGRMYMESKQRPLFIIQDIRATQERHDTANPVHRLNRQLRQVING